MQDERPRLEAHSAVVAPFAAPDASPVFRNQIIGLVRFSYISRTGFKQQSADADDRKALIYAPDRMERRFRLFEQLTLPSLLAQSDRDFQTIFLVGRGFPATALERLQALIKPLVGAHVVEQPPMPQYRAIRRGFDRLRDRDHTHLTSFRLDDDDAIDRDHIARLRRWTGQLAGMLPADQPFVTGCNRGFFLKITPQGNSIVDVVEQLPLGIGLALTAPMVSRENIYRRNHRALPQYYSTFGDAQVPAFIRTIHVDNDSRPYCSGLSGRMNPEEVAQAIAAGFPFDIPHLMAL